MKYENSLQMKHLTFLKHQLAGLLKKVKKLAIVIYHNAYALKNGIADLHTYTSYFSECEELKIFKFRY